MIHSFALLLLRVVDGEVFDPPLLDVLLYSRFSLSLSLLMSPQVVRL